MKEMMNKLKLQLASRLQHAVIHRRFTVEPSGMIIGSDIKYP